MSNFAQIGFNNMISVDKIVAIAVPDSAPIRRSIQEHRDSGKLIDLTCGRKTKAIIFFDSGDIALSALATDTIVRRISNHPEK